MNHDSTHPLQGTHPSEPPVDAAAARVLARFMQIRSASGPVLSHDGEILFFLSDLTGTPQIWYIDATSPWPQQLTFGEERVQYALRAPDGQHLLYATDVGGNERSQLHLLDYDGLVDVDLTHRPDAFHAWGCWSPEGRRFAFATNRRHTAYFDVWVMDTGTGEAHPLHEASTYLVPQAWSHDGRWILVWELMGSFSNALYLLAAEGPQAGQLLPLAPASGDHTRYHGATFSADGSHLLILSDRGREHLALGRIEVATGALSWMVEGDWDVEQLILSADGAVAAWVVNEDGVSVLHVGRVNPDGRLGEALPSPIIPRGRIEGLSMSGDGARLAFSFHGPRHNPDVWEVETATGKVRQRTFSSRVGLDHQSFVEPEVVRFTSFDGRQIPGNLYLPPHRPEDVGHLPVIIHVHGGPESQARVGFSWLFQYLLRRGYGVFAPNVRGSTGYGRTYADLDNTTRRLDSVRDLVAAGEWLKGLGPFDPKKVVVMGGSYGGYMTLAALSLFPEHWAAGIDIVGIANLRTFIQNTGAYRRKWRVMEYGDPEVIGDFMDSVSPIHHVHRIQSPLMVIHGANDPRVPKDEADQIVRAVRERGGVCEYLLYEDEGHGISKLKNRIHCYTRVVAFLDRHIR